MRLTLIPFTVLIALAITACQKSGIGEADAAAPDTAGSAAKKDLPNSVELDPAMLANIHIEAVRAKSGRNNLSGTGKVQFNDDRTVRILAPLPGQVIDFHAGVGDPIEKDQVLFSIKSREVASLVSDYLQGSKDAQGFYPLQHGFTSWWKAKPATGATTAGEQAKQQSSNAFKWIGLGDSAR